MLRKNLNLWMSVAVATSIWVGANGPALAQSPGKPNPCPAAPCGDHCTNVPYHPTDCWTTDYGPAAADVVLVEGDVPPTKSPNMLTCQSGPYALCFYSGPSYATGTSTQRLPCIVDASGKNAVCTCKYFSSGVNYVDINGILNLNAYYQAVAECGKTGERCANITNGDFCAANPTAPNCKEASVCTYIRQQNAQKPAQSLIPGADTISDFSFAMAKDYNMKAVSSCNEGRYAGCMTAACKFLPNQPDLVECNCPIAYGPYQIGQVQPDGTPYPCNLGDVHVWSAANTINVQASSSKN